MQDKRNMILAILLSIIVLFGWQFFIIGPQIERQAKLEQIAAEANIVENGANGVSDTTNLPTPSANASINTNIVEQAPQQSGEFADRLAAIASSPRVKIDTPSLIGSINLVGARLDDLELKKYNESVDDNSPIITYLSPANGPNGYFIDQGWVPAGGDTKLPNSTTLWQVRGNTTLTEKSPVHLTFDNGEGLEFTRTYSLDENYLFSVTQTVKNLTNGDVALYPYSRIQRIGTPDVTNFFVLHEGAIGVLGEENLIEKKYKDLTKDLQIDAPSTGGWLGFTDKYWAAVIMPKQDVAINARFSWSNPAAKDIYQSSFVGQNAMIVSAGRTIEFETYMFAGAKVESIIDNYEQTYGFDRFELLIDWGWFHFITKPMFYAIRWLNELLGNFGLAILALTVGVKLIFFPLANRSYASMAAMRKVQPEMKALQARYKDDKMEQQKAVMELYKREKISPLSGCWPMLIQIPVFFSLYKVLFVTIEMRHAPFFGWIVDLAAPDPTRIFNLLGLLPYDPINVPLIGTFLAIGIWPVIMGITMWVQFKLNPPPPDPTQAAIFAWMPVLFTFMLGTFPAGLVIYWAWNNFLSVTQQYFIMKRHGVDVNLLENIVASFKKKTTSAQDENADIAANSTATSDEEAAKEKAKTSVNKPKKRATTKTRKTASASKSKKPQTKKTTKREPRRKSKK
ncbi:MAG: membrane protein insertase YidC [Devosiaceae bacterium]|nr:membrane protein insertase YidC [Devosiaceae bacterium]